MCRPLSTASTFNAYIDMGAESEPLKSSCFFRPLSRGVGSRRRRPLLVQQRKALAASVSLVVDIVSGRSGQASWRALLRPDSTAQRLSSRGQDCLPHLCGQKSGKDQVGKCVYKSLPGAAFFFHSSFAVVTGPPKKRTRYDKHEIIYFIRVIVSLSSYLRRSCEQERKEHERTFTRSYSPSPPLLLSTRFMPH